MLFRQLCSPLCTEKSICNTDAQLTIIILHSTFGSYKLRLSFQIDPSLLNIFHKSGNTVQSMALNAVCTGLGMNCSTGLGLLFCKAQI